MSINPGLAEFNYTYKGLLFLYTLPPHKISVLEEKMFCTLN